MSTAKRQRMVFAGLGVSRFRARRVVRRVNASDFDLGELDCRVQLVLAAFRLRAHCVQEGAAHAGLVALRFLRLLTRMLTSQHPISRLRAYGNSV